MTAHVHCQNRLFGESKVFPMQDLPFHILGVVAQFERSILKTRQAEGIAKVKKKAALGLTTQN